MIKAIFFDIDGTLVSFATHEMSQTTRDAIIELRSKGIKTFIATGRSDMLIDNVETELFDGVISFNGQHCRDKNGKTIYKQTIDKVDITNALKYVEECNISCLFEGTDFMSINNINQNAIESTALLDLKLPDPEHLSVIADKEVIQLIFFGDEEQERELLSVMPSCEGTRWHSTMSDIIPKGGGKHIGLQKTIEQYNIKREETMAFGDGENDMSMLQYAGIGVAMGNASDKVKSAADYITDSIDDNGLVNALRHFRLI